MHGQFVWYELTTPDVDAARRFYPRFTGWGTQPFDKDYTMWTSGGVPIGGVFRLTDEMRQQGIPPNWMPYVESANVDETAAKATSLGGRVVHGPADIPGVGRYAVLQDPQGAAFGVYKPSTPGRAWDGTPVVGRFSWHELMTTDVVAAFEFYRALFGWEKTGEMDMGDGQPYVMYGKGDKMYGGMFNRSGDMASMPPFWLVYIHVKDVATAVDVATKAGATVHRPQMDVPGGAIAILGDPQGAGFALHHASAQVSAAKPAASKAARKAATKGAKRGAKAAAKKSAAKSATKSATKASRKSSAKPMKAAAKKSPKKQAKAATRPKAKRSAVRKARPSARPATRTKAKAPARSAGRSSAPAPRGRARAGTRAKAKKR
jgi:uncharacterized protein